MMSVPMQVICPHCDARYEFDKSAIPAAGYDAQCTNCEQIFFVAPEPEAAVPVPLPSANTPPPRPGAPRGDAAIQISIACPSCNTIYQFSAADIPEDGYEAECSSCHAGFSVPRAGLPGERLATTVRMQAPVVLDEARTPSMRDTELAPLRARLSADVLPLLEPELDSPAPARTAPPSIHNAPTVELRIEPPAPAPGPPPSKPPPPPPEALLPAPAPMPPLVTPAGQGSGRSVAVPGPTGERSRAGAASWGPPAPSQVPTERLQVQEIDRRPRHAVEAEEARRVAPPRGPSFDDLDDSSAHPEVRQIVDEVVREERRGRAWRAIAGFALVLVLGGAAGSYAFAPSVYSTLFGRFVPGHISPAQVVERTRAARLDFEKDTDAGYETAARALAEVRGSDPSYIEAIVLDALIAAFRGADELARAKQLAAEGDERLQELNRVLQASPRLPDEATRVAELRKLIEQLNARSIKLRELGEQGLREAERILDEARPRGSARTLVSAARGIVVSFSPSRLPQAQAELGRVGTTAATDPVSPLAAFLRARTAQEVGELERARAAYEEALALAPNWHRVRYELARVHERSGQRDLARTQLIDLMRLNPDHTRARELLLLVGGRAAAGDKDEKRR